MPVGPQILWPEKARKSQPISRTSTRVWPALWAASTTVMTPASRARRQSSVAGLTEPIVLEMCVNESSLARSSCSSSCERSSVPSSPLTGMNSSLAPVRFTRSCQGTRLLWCSISVSKIVSPSPIFSAPQVWATKFRLSVVPRVKMISSRLSALRYSAMR